MKTKPTPMEQALAFLSRKDYTCLGMTAALTKKGYTETEIRVVVEKLTDWGYLNDRAYAAAEIERLKLDGKSRAFIRHRLETAGVAPVIIATEIERAYPQEGRRSCVPNGKSSEEHLEEGRRQDGRTKVGAEVIVSHFLPKVSRHALRIRTLDSVFKKDTGNGRTEIIAGSYSFVLWVLLTERCRE